MNETKIEGGQEYAIANTSSVHTGRMQNKILRDEYESEVGDLETNSLLLASPLAKLLGPHPNGRRNS